MLGLGLAIPRTVKVESGVAAPANTLAPAIDNTSPQVGDTLTRIIGTWTNAPTSYAYQWKRDGVNIAGETATTYVVQAQDIGTQITVTETAMNAGGSASATSDPTDAVVDVLALMFTHQIRGDQGSALGGIKDTFDHFISTAAASNVKVTWLARYDTIKAGSAYLTQLLALAADGHEVSCWMEIQPDLALVAGVTMNDSSGTEFAASRVSLLGYSQADRQALIDAHFFQHHLMFGSYPSTFAFWEMDTWSANYVHDTYGVNSIMICRDQAGTDGYTVLGAPKNQHWEMHPNWIMARGRSGIAVCRIITEDVLQLYGQTEGTQVWSLEPLAISRCGVTMASFWEPLLLNIEANKLPQTEATVNEENGYLWASGADRLDGVVTYAYEAARRLSDLGTIRLRTAAQRAAEYLALSTTFRDANIILRQTADPAKSTDSKVLEICTLEYRMRIRYLEHATAGYVAITDWRVLPSTIADPNDSVVATGSGGNMQIPGIVGVQVGASYPDTPTTGTFFIRAKLDNNHGGTSSNDFDYAGPSGNISITTAPSGASPYTLAYTNGAAGSSVVIYPRGILWTLTGTMDAAGSYRFLQCRKDAAFPVTQLWSIAGSESTQAAGAGSFNIQYAVEYFVVYADSEDSALIFFPVSKTSGTWMALMNPILPAFGIETTASGAHTVVIAVLACAKADWRARLAELQANVMSALA